MKRKLLAAFICCASLQLAAQNLVPNPRFELARPTSSIYTYQNPKMEKYQKGCLENLFRYTKNMMNRK